MAQLAAPSRRPTVMKHHTRTRLRVLMSPKRKRVNVGEMDSRTNQTAAMIIDLAVILLPEVGIYEAALMLRRHLTPLPIAFRTLATTRRRRVDYLASVCKIP